MCVCVCECFNSDIPTHHTIPTNVYMPYRAYTDPLFYYIKISWHPY